MIHLRRVIIGVLATAIAPTAHSALAPVRITATPTPSGVIDTQWRNGDDGTTAIPLSWGGCSAVNLTVGGSCATNLRTACNLIEAGSPTATLSLLSGTLPAGCSISGNGITGTVSGASSSSVVVRATRNSATADTAPFVVTATTSGTDTTAPTVPLGLAGVDNTDGTATLSWLASGDPSVSGTVTGVASYQIKLGGAAVATVTAPSANVQPALTAYEVGSDTGEASSQSGADWTITYSGAGLGSTTDGIYGRWAPITGDYVATMGITSYTPTTGTSGSVGIAARASSSVAGAQAVYSRWRDSDDKCNLRYRGTTDGAAANGTLSSATYAPGSLWIRQERTGDNFSTSCSADGVTWTVTSTLSMAPGAALYVGPFVTSGSAGNAATVVVDDFAVTQSGGVSYTYTGAGGSFAVNAYDGANRSADSAAVTVTPTGGGGGATVITVPTATHTVCNSGCDYTPSQLATVAISARAAGDVLELRTATAGGAETWAARIYCNAKSGTSGNPIWLAVRDGDQITLDTSTTSGVGLLDMTDCDYWHVVGSRDGSMTGLRFADVEARHQPPAIHDNPITVYANSRNVMIRSSTGVALIGLTIGGGSFIESSLIDKDSDMILLKYVDVGRQGTNAYDWNNDGLIPITQSSLSSEGDTDSGEVLKICASHVVIEDSYFHHSGHKMVHHCGPYQVLRRVEHNGDWMDVTDYPQYTGNHMVTVQSQLNLSQWNTTTMFGPLIEDSVIYGVGSEPEHKLTNEGMQLAGKNIIFRGNYIVQRAGADGYWGRFGPALINACGSSGAIVTTDYASYLHFYNNTAYGGSVEFSSGTLPAGTYNAGTCAEWGVKNNLFQGQQVQIKSGSNALNEYVNTVLHGTNGDYTGHSNAWKSSEWFGNVFGKHPTDPVADAYFRVTLSSKNGGSGTGSAPITDCSTWPSNWCNNTSYQVTWAASGTTAAIANGNSDPMPNPDTLRSVLTPNAASYAAMGTALALTTVDAVTDGTHISLDSARYFKDAWGISHTWSGLHAEYGDCIAIGASAATAVTARITAINYSNGDITITPSRTISNGWGVWKATDDGAGNCGAVWDAPGAAQ